MKKTNLGGLKERRGKRGKLTWVSEGKEGRGKRRGKRVEKTNQGWVEREEGKE
ncbi:MAG: hypothetical protein JXR95_12330 [Deltaproteobacteria bacterium]|nr:hypothetical protein [Deltaproteobacteria bacterium]